MLKRFGAWLADATGQVLVGAVLGSAIVVSIVNGIVRQYRILSWEAMWVIWTTIAFAFFVAFVYVGKRMVQPTAKANPSASTPITAANSSAWKVVDNEHISLPGFRFYASREDLHKYQSISEQMQSAKIIWAWWHTGMQAHTYSAFEFGVIKRLMLPDPDGPAFQSLCDAVGWEPKDIRHHVQQVTESAKKHHIDVRWTRKQTGNTMMIGDPDSVNGWIHTEMVIAHTEANRRPSFRIGRQQFSALFRHLKQAYEQVWDSATKQ